MRFALAAFVLALTLAAAGCGGDAPDVEPPTKQPGGAASVDEFVEYAEAVEEDWERSPAMAAGEFLQLDQRTAAKTTIVATASAEGSGPQTVVVTLDGLLDDSVRAERWTLTFDPDGDAYRLVEATWAQSCQSGRGQQDFSPEPCV